MPYISVHYKAIKIYAVPYVLRNKTSNPDITARLVIKFEVKLTIAEKRKIFGHKKKR